MGVIVDKQKLFLDEYHRQHTSKIISFAAWDVPAYYTSIMDEHACVRNQAGIFDISHMGDILIQGKETLAYLQFLLTNDCQRYPAGKAFYSMMCRENGGIVDDVFVYPLSETEAIMIVNAANIEKDVRWMQEQASRFDVTVINRSDEQGLIALQGPMSDQIASQIFNFDTTQIKFHEFKMINWKGNQLCLSATGYTGERGFEIMYEKSLAQGLWQILLHEGSTVGIQPIGFGARDTLRLEAGCALYGHEIDETISPLEANLGWVVRLQKNEDFLGKAALINQKQQGLTRGISGILMQDKAAIPRQGYSVFFENKHVGNIASGSFLPTLGKNGATALLSRLPQLQEGTLVEVEIRAKRYPGHIAIMPFYRSKNK